MLCASDNPFRRSKIAKQRYVIEHKEIENILSKLRDQRYCGAIEGPHGSGKSTLLEDLQQRLNIIGFSTKDIRLHTETPLWQKIRILYQALSQPKATIIFLDGGESLGLFLWYVLAGIIKLQRRQVIATIHYPCPLKTVFRTEADKTLMLQLTQKLAGKYWCATIKNIALNAYDATNGNMREVFRACYLKLASQSHDNS